MRPLGDGASKNQRSLWSKGARDELTIEETICG